MTHVHPERGSVGALPGVRPRRIHRRAHRGRVTALLSLAMISGTVTVLALWPRLAAPVEVSLHGFPREMAPGMTYIGQVAVEVPQHWAPAGPGTTSSRTLMGLLGPLTTEGEGQSPAVLCSHGALDAAGTTVTFPCEITAPLTPGRFTVTASVGDGDGTRLHTETFALVVRQP